METDSRVDLYYQARNTTGGTEMTTVEKLISQYRRQQAIVLENAPGAKVDRAQDRIEAICQKAEDAGVIDDFLAAL